MTYSPTKRIRSTIGAGGLNFCVRNGYRCDPSAIITRIFLPYSSFSQKPYLYSSLKTTQCITSFHFHSSQPWSSPRPISIS